MATHRRSIPALERLRLEYRGTLKKHHNPLIKEAEREASNIREARAHEIRKAIEEFALKFPEVTLKLKCESGHSFNSVNEIHIGLKVDVKVPAKTTKKIETLRAAADHDLAQLDLWYRACLSSMASGEGFPDFGGANLKSNLPEGVNSNYGGYIN